MMFIKFRRLLPGMLLACLPLFAQQAQEGPKAAEPGAAVPAKGDHAAERKMDRAAAYYHYSLAHMYEELMASTGRSEYSNKAIEEYRLAIENDPDSQFLNAGLAELYVRTGRIRDAVLDAQEIVKRDPNNLDARKLLGRIYLRSMGDVHGGAQSQEVLRLAIEQYEAIVKIEPENSENHLLLGRLYGRNKDMLKAETEFKAASQTDPSSEEAVVNLAFLYNDEGDPKRAAEALNAVPEQARSAKIYSALGFTYEQQTDHKKAIAAYSRALELDRDNLDAMRGLAQNLASDNQTEAALKQYLVLEDADPQDPQAAMRISEIYRRMGKFDLALEHLKKAAALSPESMEIAYNQSLLLEAQGKLDESADLLQKLVARTAHTDGNYSAGERNNRALFLERLGNIYRAEGRPLLAIETYRKIVDMGGDEASRGYQEIIDAYRERKQWADAAKATQEAVGKFPNDRALKLMLATELADDGKADESIQVARSLLKGVPEDREAQIGLSQVYARLKRWQEAEESLAAAGKLSSRPEDKEYILFLQGSMYERQKKIDLAEQTFRQVLQQDPNNAMTLNYLGYMMADHNLRLEESLAMVKKALAVDPQNGAYLDSLGWVYFKLGDYEHAEENLRKAAGKSPNDPTVQDHLAELYARTNRWKLAATHWERALDEWNKSAPGDVDPQDVSRVQKRLETSRVKLAQQKE
ncbi:MAG TPA: tetratricopeptide repeat protein [Candidatus Saccharimonadales bacterium]|jgi:tetratricopeptide (TPR) repeat protein|nr:tetratricopeptide repeat protein [Candidatus Saccharimonadales bacterium]